MGLFKPDWMSKDVEEAVRAVKIIDDDDTLLKIVKSRKAISGARSTAAGRIKDQGILTSLALQDENEWVRTAAAEKLIDRDALHRLALSDKSVYVRRAAAGRLTDESVLVEIALHDDSPNVRAKAIENITNQEVLAEVMIKSKYTVADVAEIRKKLTDPELVMKVILSNAQEHVKRELAQAITDKTAIARVAKAGRGELLAARMWNELDWEQIKALKTIPVRILATLMLRRDHLDAEEITLLASPELIAEIYQRLNKNWYNSYEKSLCMHMLKNIYKQGVHRRCFRQSMNVHNDAGEKECNTHDDSNVHFDISQL